MSPVIVPPGHAQVLVSFSQGSTGRRLSNSFGVDLTSALTQTAVNALSTDMAAAYKPILSTGSFYNGIHVVEGQDGAPLVWDSTTGTGAGTRAVATPTSPQVQFLMDKKTSLGGRKFRGRSFHIDVAEADVSADGVVGATALGLFTTFGNAMQAAFIAGDLNGMELLHSDATPPTLVQTYTIDPKVATLRRRYPR